jgi:hypothetical protein
LPFSRGPRCNGRAMRLPNPPWGNVSWLGKRRFRNRTRCLGVPPSPQSAGVSRVAARVRPAARPRRRSRRGHRVRSASARRPLAAAVVHTPREMASRPDARLPCRNRLPESSTFRPDWLEGRDSPNSEGAEYAGVCRDTIYTAASAASCTTFASAAGARFV